MNLLKVTIKKSKKVDWGIGGDTVKTEKVVRKFRENLFRLGGGSYRLAPAVFMYVLAGRNLMK